MEKRSIIYSKLLPNGLLDKSPIVQSDYDMVLEYIKKSFPKANTVQRNVDQALKRTFVLGSGSSSSKTNTFRASSRKNETAIMKKRKRITIKSVPRHLSYERYITLNEMWRSYVSELLRDVDKSRTDEIQHKLNRVDLHGAHIEVTNSNCQYFIGLKGIVIKETKNTFVLVAPNHITKTIPKAEAEFQIEISQLLGSMIIAGNNFLTRPAERACKKVKSFMEFTGSRVYRNTLRYSKT